MKTKRIKAATEKTVSGARTSGLNSTTRPAIWAVFDGEKQVGEIYRGSWWELTINGKTTYHETLTAARKAAANS